jgi:hypothetical protein
LKSNLSISRAWEETKALLARDGRLFVAVALALLVLPQSALGTFSPITPGDVTPIFYWLLIVVLLAGAIGQIAIARLAIPSNSTVGGAIKRGIGRLIPMVIALLLAFIAIFLLFFLLAFIGLAAGITPPTAGAVPSVGFLALLLVPMLAVLSIFQLVVPIAAAEEGGPLYLMSRAWALGRPNYWRLAAFLILVSVGMLLVWIFAQIMAGLAVTAIFGPPEQASVGAVLIALVTASVQAGWTIVTSAMLARIYVQLTGGPTTEASVPRSGS